MINDICFLVMIVAIFGTFVFLIVNDIVCSIKERERNVRYQYINKMYEDGYINSEELYDLYREEYYRV